MQNAKKHELQDLLILFSHTLLGVDTDTKIARSVLFNNDFQFAKDFYNHRDMMKQYKTPKPFVVDGPDIILENNDIAYGIEMFEFDASRKIKHKGSSLKINEDQIFRNRYEEPLTVKFTLEDYRKSVIESFNKHYANISNYIDNLMHDKNIKSKTIKICFVIVDKTPGNLIVND